VPSRGAVAMGLGGVIRRGGGADGLPCYLADMGAHVMDNQDAGTAWDEP
jgi:hypothetical protein